MHSKFTALRAFQVDGGWYDAYWLQQARAHASRTLAQTIVHLCRAGIAMIRARRAVAAMPAEGSPCIDGDEVARARKILLGRPG
jgi:hypothetical protein